MTVKIISDVQRPERILFAGHTHEACVWALSPKGRVSLRQFRSFKMRTGWRYLVNAGSVGYPRNDWRTTYCVYNADTGYVKCVSYDCDKNDFMQKVDAFKEAHFLM